MKVGIQLYSVKNNMAKDPIGTIKRISDIGYRFFEVANHNATVDSGVGFGVSAKEILNLLKETDSNIISAHIFPLNTDHEKMKPILNYHREIGTKYIVQSLDFYKDKDEVLRKAEDLNRIGKVCNDYGMQLLYHNHFHEFQHFGNETIFELLMSNADSELVKIELDTFWAMRGEQDPVSLLKKYGKRVRLIHQKDFTKGYEDELNLLKSVEESDDYVDMDRFLRDFSKESFTEIGTGIMDIQSIINAAIDFCESEYIVLEQDFSQNDEIESVRISMQNFKKLNNIEW